MELGAFSISLAVKDIEASRLFYEKLGFQVFGGDASQNWLIMKNGGSVIGLLPGNVREEYAHIQPRLGWLCSDARRLHRCARTPAAPQRAGSGTSQRGG
jgi:hypothetical protein